MGDRGPVPMGFAIASSVEAKPALTVPSLVHFPRLQAKKFVESVPQIVKENLSKEDAEALQKKLQELGCTVVLE